MRARALFIGGDSGPAHIAATTATPMVVLFGPTTPAVWGPWRGASAATETVDVGACHAGPVISGCASPAISGASAGSPRRR